MVFAILLVQIIHKSCREQAGIEHSSSFSLRSEAFVSLSQKYILQEYLPAGRQVGKKIRSHTLSRLVPGQFVEKL